MPRSLMLTTPRRLRHRLLPLAGAALATLAQAQDAPVPAAQPQQIVITGSVIQRMVDEAPFAITVIDAEALRSAGALINLSEALVQVPGLVVNNRHNYAQDLQLSSRGFGARAGFGVRGLRLYSDGIPATMPDGQGQVAHFDLASAARVEVLRGPFSVLYGNSSGGVIALFSAPVRAPRGEAAVDLGSFGLRQLRASLATQLGRGDKADGAELQSARGWDLRASAAAMRIDGFRPHSSARRSLANASLGWRGAQDRVLVQASAFEQPADDPLGLSRAQFEADPDQTTEQAITFDTRKTARQTQLGAAWTHQFADGALRESQWTLYAGRRSVAQWLAIPAATQASPRHGGGVIDFDRSYHGSEARLRWSWQRLDLVAGLALERQEDDRKGYENFVGSGAGQQLGVTGALRRDETNSAETRDLFTQAEARLATDWTASAGLRAGRVELQARDAFLSNGDDSGRLSFDYRNPVLGLRWQAAPGLQLHASAARGFESPTLAELAYRPDGVGGFNADLRPQRSRQAELGLKWRDTGLGLGLDMALFQVEVDDEIGVATNAGGRSSFQNVGRTRRSGAELGLSWQPHSAWRGQLVLSTLDARYVDGFLACAGTPCTAPSLPVPAGNRVAGTQRASAWAELAWRSASLGETALEWRAMARTAVNDSNSEFAPGYGALGLRWTRRVGLGPGWQAELLARADNLTGRRYVGSVIVNDANGRFYEPAAPRSFLLALRVMHGSQPLSRLLRPSRLARLHLHPQRQLGPARGGQCRR